MEFYKLFSIGLGIAQFIFGWLLWSLRREFVEQHTCNERKMCTADELGKLKTRVQLLETQAKNIETLVSSVQALALGVKELSGEVKLNTKSVTRLEGQVQHLESRIQN